MTRILANLGTGTQQPRGPVFVGSKLDPDSIRSQDPEMRIEQQQKAWIRATDWPMETRSLWAVWVLPPESRLSSALLAIRRSKFADIRRWEMVLRLMPSSAKTDRQAIRHCVCNVLGSAWISQFHFATRVRGPVNLRIFSFHKNVCFFGVDELDPV